MASEEWRVYVVRPRPGGKEGKNFTLCAEPPATLRRAGVRPLRKTSETPDRTEAEAAAREWSRDLNSSVLDGDDPSVVEVLEKHLAWREASGNSRPDTLTAYRQALRRARPLLGDVRGADLSRALVLRVQDDLTRAQLAPGTVNQTLNCVRKAWRWAFDREWVKHPWPAVARLKVAPTTKRPMTDAEVEAALAWVASYRRGYWLPLFVLLADTGARVGELLELRGAAVDRDEGIIRLGRTKTGEPRVLRPPASTLALVPEAAPDALVFQAARVGCRRGKPLNRRVVLGVFWRAVEAIGLRDPENVDLHSLRRSWITSAHEEGVPLNVSMRVTGHRSTRVHLDYARRASHDVGQAVDAVHARRRRAAGPRPWEADTAENTAEHRSGKRPLRAAKSSEFPPGSPARASCWSGQVEPVPGPPGRRAKIDTAETSAPRKGRRRAPASPFLCGHPLGDRIERLLVQDLEAALALSQDATVAEGVAEWARRAGRAKAPAKKGGRRAAR